MLSLTITLELFESQSFESVQISFVYSGAYCLHGFSEPTHYPLRQVAGCRRILFKVIEIVVVKFNIHYGYLI